ncbi:hypothetical protein KC320_g5996 [Hortaea werneckii]|nr:hypothetical protein KC320_g5996 [Hortaea werneckii]
MQRTNSLLIKYGGSTKLTDLPASFQATLKAAEPALESKYSKLVEGKIQGNKPHKSHKDDKDDKDVITVSYHTAKGTRITSIHAHDDNTWKEFPSRNASKGQ